MLGVRTETPSINRVEAWKTTKRRAKIATKGAETNGYATTCRSTSGRVSYPPAVHMEYGNSRDEKSDEFHAEKQA